MTENIKNPEDTIIVAHSLGVTSALDYLEKVSQPIKGFVSISGFADDYGLKLNSYFLKEKTIDFNIVSKNIGKAFVFLEITTLMFPSLHYII